MVWQEESYLLGNVDFSSGMYTMTSVISQGEGNT